jgi:hypothetical protein
MELFNRSEHSNCCPGTWPSHGCHLLCGGCLTLNILPSGSLGCQLDNISGQYSEFYFNFLQNKHFHPEHPNNPSRISLISSSSSFSTSYPPEKHHHKEHMFDLKNNTHKIEKKRHRKVFVILTKILMCTCTD